MSMSEHAAGHADHPESLENPERVQLAPDDLARARRLKEEVKSRLYEIGLIMGRTMGHDVLPETTTYETRKSAVDEEQTVEVVVVKLPDGTFCCMQDPPGVCECPC